MQVEGVFPIVIVSEDADGRNTGGRAVSELADALETHGVRVERFGYEDAARMAHRHHHESCLLVSIGGAGGPAGQWRVLEDLLIGTRERNGRLPIFLLGDEQTSGSVPARVLNRVQALLRLHEDAPEFLARVIVDSARRHLDRLLPPLSTAQAHR